MLQFDQLSYWEKNALTENIDYLVIGGGIVGAATALRLKEIHPKKKIVILERGYVSTGASTKNAGFACFGSVTELADDLLKAQPDEVWATVDMRWRGLKRLQERFKGMDIGLRYRGSWDLITHDETALLPDLKDKLEVLNRETERITGESNCFTYDETISDRCGFGNIHGGFYNRLEGELHTGKLLLATTHQLAAANIITLHGVDAYDLESTSTGVTVLTNYGELKAAKVGITINGFAGKFLNDSRISPARAQVIVTSPIPGFDLPGTFHYQQGYYYFRAVDNRLLLGGGRNLDFTGETTAEFANTHQIVHSLEEMISKVILPAKDIRIDYKWAGIMGVGAIKKPIIERLSKNVSIGVRMGGMGVAIGSLVGEELALLMTNS